MSKSIVEDLGPGSHHHHHHHHHQDSMNLLQVHTVPVPSSVRQAFANET